MLSDSKISSLYFEALGSQHLREQDRTTVSRFALAVEAEARAQDTALIRQVMKAQPVNLIYGQGYKPCAADEATHVTINIPGPTGLLTLPVILSGTRAGTGCWTWNGSTDTPTLRPSVLTQGHDFRCHSWINDGAAQFLEDCSHALKGQTVPLLDVDSPRAAQ